MDFPVKASRSPECGVDCVHTVGSPYDHDLSSFLHPVKEGKELGNHTPFHFSCYVFPLGGDGISYNFV